MKLRRCVAIGVLVALAAACDDDGSITSSGTSAGLTGTWNGMIGPAMSGSALRITWEATQSGDTVTGRAVLVKPMNNTPANGTLDGTITGNTLSLRFTALAGSVPGFPACAVGGTGSAAFSQLTITGTILLSFTSCVGTGLEPPDNTQITLSKQ
jgi:hypothetical protein